MAAPSVTASPTLPIEGLEMCCPPSLPATKPGLWEGGQMPPRTLQQ